MMNRWQGRIALVTGASRGIGAEICRELVKHGMKVLGCARDKGEIEKISTQLRQANSPGELVAYRCDMSKEEQITEMYKQIRDEHKKVHVCINNAACLRSSSLASGNPKDWRDMLEVGVLGVCINSREAIKLMREQNVQEGQIIQMGGITGHKIPSLGQNTRLIPPNTPEGDFNFYHGTKFMIRALTEGLRQELRDTQIRVSTISPGAVETGLLAEALTQKEADAFYGAYDCLRPKNVADAVVYILSTPASANVHDITMEPLAFQL